MDKNIKTMIDLTTCRFIIWGYKNVYHTHAHIHEGFYRTLLYMGKDVEWLDQVDDIRNKDFSNTFFITNHDCVPENGDYWPWKVQKKSVLPIRNDCFYAVHGMNDHKDIHNIFKNSKKTLSWDVLTMYAMRKKLGLPIGAPPSNQVELEQDSLFDLAKKHLEFRWATDLLPHEIEANKPMELMSLHNKVINWVGTIWWVNEKELSEFKRACQEDGIKFKQFGAGQKGVVSIEENIRLTRSSYMAPTITGSHYLEEGYIPCRIFKNISYGQFGITNSRKVNDLFGGKLIYNPDSYKLYYEAKERLASIHVSELHTLMDEVAQKHTYINRIVVMIKAAKIITS